jgi:hypothetical protein
VLLSSVNCNSSSNVDVSLWSSLDGCFRSLDTFGYRLNKVFLCEPLTVDTQMIEIVLVFILPSSSENVAANSLLQHD